MVCYCEETFVRLKAVICTPDSFFPKLNISIYLFSKATFLRSVTTLTDFSVLSWVNPILDVKLDVLREALSVLSSFVCLFYKQHFSLTFPGWLFFFCKNSISEQSSACDPIHPPDQSNQTFSILCLWSQLVLPDENLHLCLLKPILFIPDHFPNFSRSFQILSHLPKGWQSIPLWGYHLQIQIQLSPFPVKHRELQLESH